MAGRAFYLDVGRMTQADAIKLIRQIGKWAKLGGWRYSGAMTALFLLEERMAEFDSTLKLVDRGL